MNIDKLIACIVSATKKEDPNKPPIQKVYTKKHYNQTQTPKAIIYHIDLGTYKGTKDWIFNGPRSVSYNYYIKTNGDIVEFVPPNKGAWHAGVVHKPNLEARKFFGNKNPNKMSIGICYEGKHTYTPPSEAQIASTKRLRDWLKGIYPIKGEFAHIEVTNYKPAIVLEFKNRVVE